MDSSSARTSPASTPLRAAGRAGRAYDGFVSSLLRAKRRRGAAAASPARPRAAVSRGDQALQPGPARS